VAARHRRPTGGVKPQRRHTVAVAAFCLFLIAPPAGAGEATAAEVAQLARGAADDPVALEQLRQIDVVDGRATDLNAVLATDDETALRARLDTLARLTDTAAPQDLDAAAAASAAAAILEHPRYGRQGTDSTTPSSTEPSGSKPPAEPWYRGLLDAAGVLVPILALLAFAAAVIWAVSLLAKRRSGLMEPKTSRLSPGQPLEMVDPGELERLAADAEAEGRFDDALRFRFRAGLLRLDAAGRIALEPWSTGRQVAAELSSEPFNRILSTFEPVVYGDQIAVDEDAAAARRDWQHVLSGRT